MQEQTNDIDPSTWTSIVKHMPIPAVDLVIKDDNALVLGRRTNSPAKGYWFVPGGRLLKGETLNAAVHRITSSETGIDVEIQQQLGVYEHHYDTADVQGTGKHYIAVCYIVTPQNTRLHPDNQHSRLEWFAPDDLPEPVHPYTRRYLEDAGVI